jgi:hypothetical protein
MVREDGRPDRNRAKRDQPRRSARRKQETGNQDETCRRVTIGYRRQYAGIQEDGGV